MEHDIHRGIYLFIYFSITVMKDDMYIVFSSVGKFATHRIFFLFSYEHH